MTQQLAPTTSDLALTAILATAAAALINFAFVFVLTNMWQIVAIFSSGVKLDMPLLNWAWSGAILAAPITLILLPASAIVGRRHPVVLYVLPLWLIGFVGAILVAKMWAYLLIRESALVSLAKMYLSFEAPSVIGIFHVLPSALGGLLAGIIFSMATRKIRP